MSKPTLPEIIGEFDAGIFEDKAIKSLKMAALGVIDTGKKGQVSIIIDLDLIGDSSSVQVKHTLKYTKPTKNGKSSEENTTTTPMYVDREGYLTISPETQEDLFKAEAKNNITKIKG